MACTSSMATAVLSSFHSTENAPHPIHVEDLTLKQKQEAQRERRLKDAVRRYYALVELVETERGYLTDLRILVQVSLFGLSRFFFFFSSSCGGCISRSHDLSILALLPSLNYKSSIIV